jgi:hypothetical protein
MIEKIAEKDFDVDEFVKLAINDEIARNEIVHQMPTNSAIMVYIIATMLWKKPIRNDPSCFIHI